MTGLEYPWKRFKKKPLTLSRAPGLWLCQLAVNAPEVPREAGREFSFVYSTAGSF